MTGNSTLFSEPHSVSSSHHNILFYTLSWPSLGAKNTPGLHLTQLSWDPCSAGTHSPPFCKANRGALLSLKSKGNITVQRAGCRPEQTSGEQVSNYRKLNCYLEIKKCERKVFCRVKLLSLQKGLLLQTSTPNQSCIEKDVGREVSWST